MAADEPTLRERIGFGPALIGATTLVHNKAASFYLTFLNKKSREVKQVFRQYEEGKISRLWPEYHQQWCGPDNEAKRYKHYVENNGKIVRCPICGSPYLQELEQIKQEKIQKRKLNAAAKRNRHATRDQGKHPSPETSSGSGSPESAASEHITDTGQHTPITDPESSSTA